jgi:3-hydroxyisobutyrate dehydrogenase-like beta-hydroxyacid dehydrogenase
MKIAFLGLGIMGSRMAANIIHAHPGDVTVWNRTSGKADDLVSAGAREAKTPKEAAQDADVLWTMLSTPEAVEETALGTHGFLDSLKKGALWVDSSTVDPSFTRRMAEETARRGIRFLDAPVTGSKEAAQKAQLVFLVGGSEADLNAVRPLMEHMSRAITHVGDVGMGSSLKVVNNMMAGIALLAFSEGLILGESLGIDRQRLFDIFIGGPIIAPIAGMKRAKLESGNFEADFPLQWMQKDLHLAAQTAYEKGVALPVANTAKEIYLLAARYGFAELDFSSVYDFLRKNSV